RGHLAPVAHDGDQRQRPAADTLDRGHDLVELGAGGERVAGDVEVAADVEGGDVGPARREREAVGAALAAGGTGDEGDLPGEVGNGGLARVDHGHLLAREPGGTV